MRHINDEQIDEIIRLEQGGLSQRAISRVTGHSRMTVRRHVQRFYEARICKAINEYTHHVVPVERTYFGFWMITIGVILLVGTLIHYLINHV